jgi:hypothetical protein
MIGEDSSDYEEEKKSLEEDTDSSDEVEFVE